MKRIVAAAVMTTVLAGSAYAQGMSMGAQKTPAQAKDEQKEQYRAANERQYNETMKRLKAQPPANAGKTDPWAGVRPLPDTSAKR